MGVRVETVMAEFAKVLLCVRYYCVSIQCLAQVWEMDIIIWHVKTKLWW